MKSKYKSVIIKGFQSETSLDNALQVISENGLPAEFDKNFVNRNEKTGVLTITNLTPDQCLELMEKMHAKKFLGKKIFVTSVVDGSPVKPPPSDADNSPKTTADLCTGNPTASKSNCNDVEMLHSITSPILDPKAASSLATSKSIDCQSSSLDQFEFDSPLRGFRQDGANNDQMFELPNKRKASISPESKELSRKEKKAAKRDQKIKNRGEQKAKLQLDISPDKK